MARRTTLQPGDPFLKWAGGKRKLLPKLLSFLPERIGTYHEPFMGGGALFFALAAQQPRRFEAACIADGNQRLMRCYRAVRDEVDQVIALLRGHAQAHSKDYFYALRDVPPDPESDAYVASWLVYFNRTAFNGLYRVNSKNKFNVPFGSYKNPRICNEPHLRACSALLQGVVAEHEPFDAVLERAVAGDAVYFDPPYVGLSDTANFTSYTKSGFGPEDQVHLRDVAVQLAERDVFVMLSNHDTPWVRELYDEARFELHPVQVARSINSKASKRGAVGELIILARRPARP